MKQIRRITWPDAIKLTPAEMNKLHFASGRHSDVATATADSSLSKPDGVKSHG